MPFVLDQGLSRDKKVLSVLNICYGEEYILITVHGFRLPMRLKCQEFWR